MRKAQDKIQALKQEIAKVIVGQHTLVEALLIALLADGHLLLEGMPGLAKTKAVTTLARAVACTFRRIQFTPDLLPSDLIGTSIYNPRDGTFSVQKGPVFANIVLADEINRAPAKVQSALLEVMEERQVTIGGETFAAKHPFLVMATQNPIEQEGTYPLPEAQQDRFLMKVCLNYPTKEEEKAILYRLLIETKKEKVKAVAVPADIFAARAAVGDIYVDAKIVDYIVDIVVATRGKKVGSLDTAKMLTFGASPRATLALTKAAKAHAFLSKRAFVSPHDVKTMAPAVLRHRLGLTYEAQADGITVDNVINRLLNNVVIP
ncbi:MoxR family ATPase [Simkania negevensis]|uniref:MoxR family ATPase n=1 Tax=Simkania negevensis TaxID=83561 RepID=A0ABS3AQQ1_9BACT|nr:MoxR family ATPase [Simkania negevensis]